MNEHAIVGEPQAAKGMKATHNYGKFLRKSLLVVLTFSFLLPPPLKVWLPNIPSVKANPSWSDIEVNYYFDGFENNDDGDTMFGWKVEGIQTYTHRHTPPSSAKITDSIVAEGTKSVKFNDTSPLGGVGIYQGFHKDYFFLEYFARAEQTDNTLDLVCITQNSTLAVSTAFWSDGNIKYHNGTQWQIAQSYSSDTWYLFKYEVNVTSNKWNFWINGSSIASNIDFRQPVSSINRIQKAKSRRGTGVIYIDSVKAYTTFDLFMEDLADMSNDQLQGMADYLDFVKRECVDLWPPIYNFFGEYNGDPNSWSVSDQASDNYPKVVNCAHFTDNQTEYEWLLQTLEDEKRYTSRYGSMSHSYNFQNDRWDSYDENKTYRKGMVATRWANLERVKDGLFIPMETGLHENFTTRARNILYDIDDNCSIPSDYGFLPADDAETNGIMMQAAGRMYFIDNDLKLANATRRIADAYVYEVLEGSSVGLPSNRWNFTSHSAITETTTLRDHGMEIFEGLLWALLVEQDRNGNQTKIADYESAIDTMLTSVLDYGTNSHGQLYQKLNSNTGAVVNTHIVDTGYIYFTIYDYYLLNPSRLEYYNASKKYVDHSYKYEYYKCSDSCADYVESLIGLYLRFGIDDTARNYLAEQLIWLHSLQDNSGQTKGMIDGRYSDGSTMKAFYLYNSFLTQGVRVQNWTSDLKWSAHSNPTSGRLSIYVQSDSNFSGTMMFDEKRYSTIWNLDTNYARTNEYPEWFALASSSTYVLKNLIDNSETEYAGSALINGISIELGAGESQAFELWEKEDQKLPDWSYRQEHNLTGAIGKGSNYPIYFDMYRGEEISSGSFIYLSKKSQSLIIPKQSQFRCACKNGFVMTDKR